MVGLVNRIEPQPVLNRHLRADARDEFAKAVKLRLIKKPIICSQCRCRAMVKRDIHAHHRDYSKPLEVDWLCRSCHSQLHADITALSKKKYPRSIYSGCLGITHQNIENLEMLMSKYRQLCSEYTLTMDEQANLLLAGRLKLAIQEAEAELKKNRKCRHGH